MKRIKVAAATLNQTPLDWKGNRANILAAIQEATEQKVDVLCLPELCITGYGCEDHFHSADVQERAFHSLLLITEEVGNMLVTVGLPFAYRNALYNVTAVILNREILGFVAKQHLAGDGIHYEPRWFKPWPAGHAELIHVNYRDKSGKIFMGDLFFESEDGIRLGFEICEDAWVAERPGARLARQGVDIILNPSASHFAFGKYRVRERLVTEGSRAFSATYVYANLLGNEAGRAIYDGHCLIATGGSLVAKSERFSMLPVVLTTAVVDLDDTRTQQQRTASFSPQYENEGLCKVGFDASLTNPSTEPLSPPVAPERAAPDEFVSAQTLALFDYMRKSRSQGFVISLSGGVDSAACAVLVREMVREGIRQLGKNFPDRLGIKLPDIAPEDLPDFMNTILREILTCVYQSTRNSSKTTLEAAQGVAQDVGAKFLNIDVDAITETYTKLVGDALSHTFSWETDDLALQNIQARARAPGVWMVANLERKLLITTSNRSESAVGYCTMDGDTAGSIAPLAGIDKDFLYHWLCGYAYSILLSYPNLKKVTEQQPTAELRPGSTQTDENDLMPYSILEFIEDQAILKKRGPKEVHQLLVEAGDAGVFRPKIVMLPTVLAYLYVEKFFTLWCRNQWKRERYALSFHLDDKNLDPRSWCRFPVLSGGFKEELAELRAELKI